MVSVPDNPQNVNVYRRYVHELVKAFRTQTGEPLAQAIPLTIRKWANLGLEPALLQGLLGDCFLRFEQNGYAKPTVTPSADGKKRGPKARRLPRRSYERALKKGRASLGRSNTVEQQSARHRASSGRAAEIAGKLKPVLAGCGITGPHFVRYFAFAQKLGRYARNYSGESLRMVASDLVDLYEAKSLNGYALRAIAAALFGVTSLD